MCGSNNSVPLNGNARARRLPISLNGKVIYIYGGRYVNRPSPMVGVKMAAEINRPCDISIPTLDFSVPDEKEFKMGVIRGLLALMSGKRVFVGCMGGVGRTGIYLAAITKVVSRHDNANKVDPVAYVRAYYDEHAVETDQQEQYLKDFDVQPILKVMKYGKLGMKLYLFIFDNRNS